MSSGAKGDGLAELSECSICYTMCRAHFFKNWPKQRYIRPDFRYQHRDLLRLIPTSITIPAYINQLFNHNPTFESRLAAVRRVMVRMEMQ